jgi:hypothetical protein
MLEPGAFSNWNKRQPPAVAVHEAENGDLLVIGTTDRLALLAANVGLVHFDRATVLPEWSKATFAHGFTNAMREEPSSLDG